MSVFESGFKNLFLTILELIDYSYSEMLNDNVEFHLNDHGRDSQNNMPLENSITNRLVGYIRNNKNIYDLNFLGFDVEPGSDFSEEYATKGYIDIKISNITSSFSKNNNETVYFAFECKRVNKNSKKVSKYVDEGINRFKINKYAQNVSLSGMIGYSEENYTEIPNIIKKINNKLVEEKLNKNEEDIDINYAYCYVSTHSRENSDEITLYHLFYDFSDMIKQAN